jgi:hypothetical protein
MTDTDPILARYLGDRDTVATRPTRDSVGSREELVELLVLAEHGDRTAVRQLDDWLATDSTAQMLRTRITRDVDALRAGLDPPARQGIDTPRRRTTEPNSL